MGEQFWKANVKFQGSVEGTEKEWILQKSLDVGERAGF